MSDKNFITILYKRQQHLTYFIREKPKQNIFVFRD